MCVRLVQLCLRVVKQQWKSCVEVLVEALELSLCVAAIVFFTLRLNHTMDLVEDLYNKPGQIYIDKG